MWSQPKAGFTSGYTIRYTGLVFQGHANKLNRTIGVKYTGSHQSELFEKTRDISWLLVHAWLVSLLATHCVCMMINVISICYTIRLWLFSSELKTRIFNLHSIGMDKMNEKESDLQEGKLRTCPCHTCEKYAHICSCIIQTGGYSLKKIEHARFLVGAAIRNSLNR